MVASAQEEFDERYVSSTELCRVLGVTRSSVVNRRRAGHLPGAIEVRRPDGTAHVLLWLRDELRPHVEAWRSQLTGRRAA